MIQDTIGTVLNRMTDEYIENLRQNGSIRKPNMKNLVRVYKPAKRDMKELLGEYDSLLEDINGAIEEKDEDLIEAWDFLNKTKLGHLRDFVENVRLFLDENSQIKRTKRKINKANRVKKVKYLESCEGVQSINPEKIIGMHYFVCYNCKTRKIYFYESESGFDIKGTTLQNFNSQQSFCKSFGRSKLTLKQIQESGILAIRQEMERLGNKVLEATGRINGDMILVKVS